MQISLMSSQSVNLAFKICTWRVGGTGIAFACSCSMMANLASDRGRTRLGNTHRAPRFLSSKGPNPRAAVQGSCRCGPWISFLNLRFYFHTSFHIASGVLLPPPRPLQVLSVAPGPENSILSTTFCLYLQFSAQRILACPAPEF